jgi:hypothetical protein
MLDGAREALGRFDAEMTDLIGASPDALLGTIHGLSIHTLMAMRKEARIAAQLFTSAYPPMSCGEHYDGVCKNVGDWVQRWWRTKRGEEIGHGDATELARQAFGALTYTPADIDEIDLWTRTPLRLVIDEQRALFDFEAIAESPRRSVRTRWLHPRRPRCHQGHGVRGRGQARGGRQCFVPWRTGVVKASDGKQLEIDASFTVGSTLFLVGCKAFSQNPRIEIRDFVALHNRWSTLKEKYLKQARTLCDFVKDHRKDDRIGVPDGVGTFEYAVCTPGVEWVRSRDSKLGCPTMSRGSAPRPN